MKRAEYSQPKNKGIAKVPMIIQLEALECGAACLDMILAYYGRWIPLEQVRKDCGVSRDGSSAINIVKAARSYGMKASGYRLEPEDLAEDGLFPCIIHWNMNHFVVLDGFKHGKAYINDPARGRCRVSMEEFDESFSGICIVPVPTEEFAAGGHKKSVWQFARKRLSGLKIPIIITILTTVVTSLIGIISPVLSRIFYDRLLTAKSPDWAGPFFLSLAVLYLIEAVTLCISAGTNLRINGKMSLVGSLSYMWKTLHLPMHFFSQRMTGDIVSRQSGNALVSNTIVSTLSPMILNAAMMVFYLVVMIRYSFVLTLVGICSVIINLAVSQLSIRRRVDLSRVLARDNGILAATTVSGIQVIESIKASGAEEGFFEKWAGNFARVNNNNRKYERDTLIFTVIPQIVSSVCGSIILGIGIYLVIEGDFTLGSITAFQGFYTSFMSPVSSFINAGETIQNMRTAMERIDDVMEYPDDDNIAQLPEPEAAGIEKLSGNIEINHISFGYSPLAAPVIEDFSINIKRGSRIAIVGGTGCGKSTVSKLISGLYTPWSGEILFDGKKVKEIDHSVFTGSLAVVDQDIIIFEDTIANNIKMWDETIEDFEMILAAKDAQLHYEIAVKDGGYNYRLTEGGKNLSGGQRQRLEIARVLAQEPNIIILDEATSALDAKTEYNVVKAISDRGITCIVIAHRLSTIRDCDEIVVLDKGHVVERGTHQELMSLGGYYTRLVTNE